MKILRSPSPNFGPRADGKKVSLVILHYTETRTTQEAIDILQSKERQVSAHYVVGDNGEILQLVDENMRAWHAGKSFWRGETDINSCSIGIEIQNPGHAYGYVPFPDAQIAAVTKLCQDIMQRHGIAAENVLAHSDVAAERKRDPGELFPWQALAESGVGIWPGEGGEAVQEDILPLLTAYGYDASAKPDILITAFQRHFEPEVFALGTAGTASRETTRRVKNLLRQTSERR